MDDLYALSTSVKRMKNMNEYKKDNPQKWKRQHADKEGLEASFTSL